MGEFWPKLQDQLLQDICSRQLDYYRTFVQDVFAQITGPVITGHLLLFFEEKIGCLDVIVISITVSGVMFVN